MLIKLDELQRKYNLKINGVVAIGAHFLEEYDDYILAGAKKIIAIEPCSDAFSVLVNRFSNNDKVTLFDYALSNTEGIASMFVSKDNQGQSNSLLMPKFHKIQHPDIVFDGEEVVKVKTLDSLPFDRSVYNMIGMDAQGNEGNILKGGMETLKHIDIIYTEVNRSEVYENCMQVDELDKLLYEFVRVETRWVGAWGDSLYLRPSIINK